MPKDTQKHSEQYCCTQNRELSWLRFNQRVLEEAADLEVPALERLKFLSIFSSNLDEFFMVRVGSLVDIDHVSPSDIDNKTGWTARRQLQAIYQTVPDLIARKSQIYAGVMGELARHGIEDVPIAALTPAQHKQVVRYFRAEMLPLLSPIIIGPHHPVPHLAGKQLHAAVFLEGKKGHRAIGIVPLPESLPPYLLLETPGKFVRTEEILIHWAPELFGAYSTRERCLLCVTRNADISFDDEKFEDNEEDSRRQMTKMLKKRDHLSVVRLEVNCPVSDAFLQKLTDIAKIGPHQRFIDPCPLNMKYVFRLVGDVPKGLAAPLLYKPYTPRWPEDLLPEECMIPQIQSRDRLLFYPYDSTEPFLRLLNEAAENPDVLSIKITIYRLASSSKVAQILCRAAEKGKDVLVLMELRARFDEANNLTWSKMLEEAGCQVIYGQDGYKCHSKICLISLRQKGKMSYITQIGTGNYNEKTNAMYTDLSYMTASPAIGEDAAAFFRNMLVNNLEGDYKELCVSPYGIKNKVCELIDSQIKLGKEGYICIKINSFTERQVIDKLREASRAGVEVQLIVRGICCLLPGIPGETETIRVTSIVGRYLEHARIYLFGRSDTAAMYIGSADLMTRNLDRRVEILCPVRDPALRDQLKWILEHQLQDTAKASFLLSDGSYCRKQSAAPFDSQQYFMEHSPHHAAAPASEPRKNKNWLQKMLAVFH